MRGVNSPTNSTNILLNSQICGKGIVEGERGGREKLGPEQIGDFTYVKNFNIGEYSYFENSRIMLGPNVVMNCLTTILNLCYGITKNRRI